MTVMLNQFRTRKRLVLIAASTAGIAVLTFVCLLAALSREKAPAFNGYEVTLAVQRFCAAHRPLPATVTFSQLVAEGYLGTNALREFGASEVTVYLEGADTSPSALVLDALMPDGTHVSCLGDGSVQTLSKRRFQETVANTAARTTPR